jgi:hypothetical protein
LGHDAVREVLGEVVQLVHPLQPEVPVVEHIIAVYVFVSKYKIN